MLYTIEKSLKMSFQWYMACLIWKRAKYTQPPQRSMPNLMTRLIGIGKVNSGIIKWGSKGAH
jgi:hypothetical protein